MINFDIFARYFCKAFDTNDKSKMFDILKAYGIPKNLIKTIAIMYGKTAGRVVLPDGNSDYFEFLSGVLHEKNVHCYAFYSL